MAADYFGRQSITTAIAIWPNCHVESDYGKSRLEMMKNICANVGRIIEEKTHNKALVRTLLTSRRTAWSLGE